jgi:hypothetical protein
MFFRDGSHQRYVLEVNHVQNGAAEFSIQFLEEPDRLFIDLLDNMLG